MVTEGERDMCRKSDRDAGQRARESERERASARESESERASERESERVRETDRQTEREREKGRETSMTEPAELIAAVTPPERRTSRQI